MSVTVINATYWKKWYYFVKMTTRDVTTTASRHEAGIKEYQIIINGTAKQDRKQNMSNVLAHLSDTVVLKYMFYTQPVKRQFKLKQILRVAVRSLIYLCSLSAELLTSCLCLETNGMAFLSMFLLHVYQKFESLQPVCCYILYCLNPSLKERERAREKLYLENRYISVPV